MTLSYFGTVVCALLRVFFARERQEKKKNYIFFTQPVGIFIKLCVVVVLHRKKVSNKVKPVAVFALITKTANKQTN